MQLTQINPVRGKGDDDGFHSTSEHPMEYLTEADREALTCQLGALRRQVMDELRATRPKVDTDSFADEHDVHSHADDAEAERLDDLRSAEIEVDRTRLHDIEQAQQRMACGRYGLCVDCGAGIPRARLLAQPTAIRCATCQASSERRQHC